MTGDRRRYRRCVGRRRLRLGGVVVETGRGGSEGRDKVDRGLKKEENRVCRTVLGEEAEVETILGRRAAVVVVETAGRYYGEARRWSLQCSFLQSHMANQAERGELAVWGFLGIWGGPSLGT